MIDATYFHSALQQDVQDAGGSPVMEISLLNGHVHRVQSIDSIADGYVVLLVHTVRGDLSHERPRFGGPAGEVPPVRVVVSYDSIAAVLLDPSVEQVKARPGFASA